MRVRAPAGRTRLSAAACAILAALAAGPAAGGQDAPPVLEHRDAEELLGGSVFSMDGTEVGEVSSVALKPDGTVSEIRITVGRLLGVGEKVVIVPPGTYMLVRGAIILELSPSQVRQLPSAAPGAPG